MGTSRYALWASFTSCSVSSSDLQQPHGTLSTVRVSTGSAKQNCIHVPQILQSCVAATSSPLANASLLEICKRSAVADPAGSHLNFHHLSAAVSLARAVNEMREFSS